MVSSSASSEAANAFSTNPRISGDGRYVVFQSQATNLVNTSDTNGVEDIFWKDMDTGEVYLVSSSHSGEIGLAASQDATVSDDGKLVVFRSGASNLVLGDTNGSTDIFLKHTDSDEIKRISVTSAGLEDPSGSYYSALSGDGGAIIFSSYGTGLIQPDINGSADVFLYDRAGRTAPASPLFLPYVPTAPGEPGPFSFAGIDQLAITNQSVALDANNSSMTNAMSGNTGYQWSLLSVPAGSTVLLNSSSPTPDFVPDIAGSYELRLTAENGQEVSDDEMIIYVTDNGAPTTEMIDFVADVYPVFNSRCATACHSAGGVAPSFDAPVVAGVVETLYRHFYSRVDVMDVTNSLLLQKPLGQLNHGGSTVFASTVDADYQTLATWIAQGASRQITLPTAANSDFATAEPIIGDVIAVSGSTFNAGVEPGEPMHANISGGNSVWYLWTPLATGVFQFDLTSTDFNTLLAVYTGSSIDELTTVAFNDDTVGTDSQLVFQAIEGESYYIAVDSHGGTGGEFTLTLDGPLPIGAVNIPFVPYSAQIALFFMLFTLAYRCRALKG